MSDAPVPRPKPCAEDRLSDLAKFLAEQIGFASARIYRGGLSEDEAKIELAWTNRLHTALHLFADEEMSGDGWT